MKNLSILEFIREFFRITWYSVSSKNFYPNLYHKYRGYGIKYISTILAFTTFIYLLLAYANFQNVKNYLHNLGDEENPLNFILDWPEVSYENGSISWDEEEPHIIKNTNGKDLIAIDPNNKLSPDKKNQIPLVLLERNILVNFLNQDAKGAKAKEATFPYSRILGDENKILNPDTIRESLVSLFDFFNIFTLLLLFPILTFVRLLLHLYSNLFGILILYLIFLWMGLKPKVNSVTRVVLFTGAAAEVLSCILVLLMPAIVNISLVLEYWATILAVYTITKNIRIKSK